jgi:C4-dicarboxylate-specific signal transduction histidine kinase
MNHEADEPIGMIVRHSDTRELEPVVPSGRRAASAFASPRHWLSALLDLSLELPPDAPVDQIEARFLDAVSELLPTCALGLCVVDPITGRSTVQLRLPEGVSDAPGRDPTRLFPGMARERVFQLGGDSADSTLHVATDSPEELAADSENVQLAERASEVLTTALARSRRFQTAEGADADVRRLQAQVIQAEKLASLGQIVAGLVHELNNPLTSIVAYSDYLIKQNQRRLAAGEDLADDLERLRRILEGAERILKFSRELVAYARPTADVPAPVRLDQVIDKALVFCEHEFQAGAVMVDRHFDKGLPPVRGVAGQLTQVFVNLFTNAAHAMLGREGRLQVRIKRLEAKECVFVEVTDTGVGIEPEALSQIFEPFYTTKSDGRGTGLGLSIVRDIVTSHGGSLTASSVVGEGTVFRVELPIVRDVAE